MNEGMHNLMGKYLSGEASPSESAQLKEWIGSDEKNQEEFRAIQELWDASGDDAAPIFSTDTNWKRLHARIQESKSRAKVIAFRRAVAGVAAAVILTVGWWIQRSSGGMESFTATEIAQNVKLPDGSTVFLKNGSTIHYPSEFKSKERNVTLDGEGFFDVAHDANHPFIIAAGEAKVQVLGTSFSVIESGTKVELIVKTGRVKFTSKKDSEKEVIVVAGERAMLNENSLTKSLNTDQNFNAWQSKQLVFNNTPFTDVIKAIENCYGISFSVNEPERAQILSNKLTTSFKNQPLDTVLKEVEMITTFHIRQIASGSYEISLK